MIIQGKQFNLLFLTVALLALVVTGCPAEENDAPIKEVKLAASPEFIHEQEGLASLEETYDFRFDLIYEMAIGLTHEALRNGDVDAAIGYATDGKIEEIGLIKLEDDQHAFPARNPAPVIRSEVLEMYPEIEPLLEQVAPLLDNITMTHLNYLVDIEEKEPAHVAKEWLLNNELIGESAPELDGEIPVKVSSKEFTQQLILRHITLLALENAGVPVVDMEQIAGTENIRSALLIGTIDLYWEYTGIAWNTIYDQEEVITDPELVYDLISEKDIEHDLVWLDYAPLNKTYTVMMIREQADALEIVTISDLADWVRQVQAGDF